MSNKVGGKTPDISGSLKIQIAKTKLLLVEGRDEEYFFKAVLENHLRIGDIQVLGIAGKTRLRENLAGLKSDSKFPDVTALAVIRDADASSAGAFESVCDSLRQHKLPVPQRHRETIGAAPRVGVFIMPDGKSDGMLETLCMRSVEGNAETACVAAYLDCLKQNGLHPVPVDKARAHAWLAGQTDPDKRVGEAAQAGLWPFANPAFDELWNFIRAM